MLTCLCASTLDALSCALCQPPLHIPNARFPHDDPLVAVDQTVAVPLNSVQVVVTVAVAETQVAVFDSVTVLTIVVPALQVVDSVSVLTDPFAVRVVVSSIVETPDETVAVTVWTSVSVTVLVSTGPAGVQLEVTVTKWVVSAPETVETLVTVLMTVCCGAAGVQEGQVTPVVTVTGGGAGNVTGVQLEEGQVPWTVEVR